MILMTDTTKDENHRQIFRKLLRKMRIEYRRNKKKVHLEIVQARSQL